MNNLLKDIRERKSIRSYTNDPVKSQDIKDILECAIWSPNAMNQQKWHFTAVTDPAMLRKMNDACVSAMAQSNVQTFNDQAMDPNYNAFYNAPAVIVVTTGKGAFTAFDAGVASQTICIAAKALGYSTCITTSTSLMFDGNPGLKADLQIPEDHGFICAITLGKEKEAPNETFRQRGSDSVTCILAPEN